MDPKIPISYTIHVARNLHDTSDEIYEALADSDISEALKCLSRMEYIIKEIRDEVKTKKL